MLAKILGLGMAGLLVVVVAVGLSALYAWPVQYLWNHVAVYAINGLHQVTFLEAWGLNILSSFLFKSK